MRRNRYNHEMRLRFFDVANMHWVEWSGIGREVVYEQLLQLVNSQLAKIATNSRVSPIPGVNYTCAGLNLLQLPAPSLSFVGIVQFGFVAVILSVFVNMQGVDKKPTEWSIGSC